MCVFVWFGRENHSFTQSCWEESHALCPSPHEQSRCSVNALWKERVGGTVDGGVGGGDRGEARMDGCVQGGQAQLLWRSLHKSRTGSASGLRAPSALAPLKTSAEIPPQLLTLAEESG